MLGVSPEAVRHFLKVVFLGNSVQAYLTAAFVFVSILAGSYLARRFIVSRLRALASRTETRVDDLAIEFLWQIRHFEFAILALFFASRGLALHPSLGKVVHILFVVMLTYRAMRVLQGILGFGIERYAEENLKADLTARSAMDTLRWIADGALCVGAILFILSNLGVNVTAAMAGLGIGGVAIALASQAILGDLFSSFTIYMDQPFRVGDFIVVGDMMGTVDHIGIKTTRVRSLGGEMLVFANSDLTNSRIRNYKQMAERRVVFSFGVLYETPAERVRRIPAMVGEVVAAVEDARFDRAHFFKFGDSSLDFEVVYYVRNGDYAAYMDCQQRINLGLMEAFQREGVGFAYPTRTLYLQKQGSLSELHGS